jgi:hypothetical protein
MRVTTVRDELRRQLPESAGDLVIQERKVREAIKNQRCQEWKNTVASNNAVNKVWPLLKRLRGDNNGEAKERALIHNGRAYITPYSKANAFAREYARTSKLTIPVTHRGIKKRLNAKLRQSPQPSNEGSLIRCDEVTAALHEIDGSKAPGPDKIHPRLLKHLPRRAVQLVTRLFNRSWTTSVVPQNWRKGEIVPLLKKGKDPETVAAYRPICLTSTLSKWMERVIANRLRHTLEEKGLLTQCQAGFRPNRTTEDHVLMLSKDISNGFEQRKKTVLVLQDYAKAYDTVWRDGLLWKMTALGLDGRLVRWVQSWLANRRAWVRYDETPGRSVTMRQGLPQGAVLSPTLFLIYINDVVDNIGEKVTPSLFADDIALWSQDVDAEVATRNVQTAVDSIAQWSREWLLTLSVAKCETSLFSLDAAQSGMKPVITIEGSAIAYNSYPTFLGVTYDRRLSFADHVLRVCNRARKRVQILRRVAGTDWGLDRELLRSGYLALVRSVLEYASCAWMPGSARRR